ncbi:MAG TPA: M13 family metallopeptidase [Vicinamibacterales bacterium]|nr:M13 family metallopeptidase [Vicinamibacterales bacterium]
MRSRWLAVVVVILGFASAIGARQARDASTAFDVSDLDPSIAPCTDLNGFVNAKWVAAHPIPADRVRWGTFDVLADQNLETQRRIVEKAAAGAADAPAHSIARLVGRFYRAGMDEAAIDRAGVTPLAPELAKIAALATQADIAAYIDDSFSRGQNDLFGVGAVPDFKDASIQIAMAGQGGLGLPTPDYYDAPDFAKLRDAYRAHVAKVLELAGTPAATAADQAAVVLAFETRLAKASLSPVDLRKPENQYHFVTLDEADRLTPHFSWTTFFKAQHANIRNGFSLSQPGFFTELDRMLVDEPVDHWQAYLRAHAIDGASPYLSAPFVDEHFAFYNRTLNGQQTPQPRWKRVLGAANDAIGMAVGELYVAETFPPEAKARAETLVRNVLAALRARIEHLDWMSDATKARALEKWQTVLPKIGYPDKWRDWSGLDLASDNYYGNVAAAQAFDYAYDMGKIGQPTDRLEWEMTPQTVNAYYNPLDNTINFPAAILQPPFFDPAADDAINYGSIGAVIGHEASHGYDDEGSQFDAKGNNTDWWTPEDRAKFEARTKVLVDQFNAYSPLPDKHVNGELTLGENIGDLAGLLAAYDALQMALQANPAEAARTIDGYTEDQRFFLSFARVWRGSVRPERQALALNADPHAPSMFRAVGPPSNMPAFAAAFHCKPGDPMVRTGDAQVKIW